MIGEPMRIVLSRKGFDSTIGRVPSPILPDGRLIPLPIPAAPYPDPHTYDGVSINGMRLAPIVEDLTRRRIKGSDRCHLDPDLDRASTARLPGWHPAFGQYKQAQRHLDLRRVRAGDLFLFFGWFREVEPVGGHWRYRRGAPKLHVIYGWMRVGKVIPLTKSSISLDELLPYADHPHIKSRLDEADNTLYVASDGGLFTTISDRRVLTDTKDTKREGEWHKWRLPGWFDGNVVSRNNESEFWTKGGQDSLFASAGPDGHHGRWQELVVTPPNADIGEWWLRTIFDERQPVMVSPPRPPRW